MASSVFPWNGFRQASKTLTDAQTKALPTTAIQIVAAPGANRVLVPTFAWWQVTWVQDYSNYGDTSSVGIQYDGLLDGTLARFREQASQVRLLLANGASHQGFMPVVMKPVDVGGGSLLDSAIAQFTDDPDPINKSLSIFAQNSGSHTGDFTGGDPGNSIRVTMVYYIYDMTSGMFV